MRINENKQPAAFGHGHSQSCSVTGLPPPSCRIRPRSIEQPPATGNHCPTQRTNAARLKPKNKLPLKRTSISKPRLFGRDFREPVPGGVWVLTTRPCETLLPPGRQAELCHLLPPQNAGTLVLCCSVFLTISRQ